MSVDGRDHRRRRQPAHHSRRLALQRLSSLPGRQLRRPHLQAEAGLPPLRRHQARLPPQVPGDPDHAPGRGQHQIGIGSPTALGVPRPGPHQNDLHQGAVQRRCLPAGSIYGTVTAKTPLLDEPLTGNVYLAPPATHCPTWSWPSEAKIDANVVGRIDSVNGGIRNTFDFVPDAPVSSSPSPSPGARRASWSTAATSATAPSGLPPNSRAKTAMQLDPAPAPEERLRQEQEGREAKARQQAPLSRTDASGSRLISAPLMGAALALALSPSVGAEVSQKQGIRVVVKGSSRPDQAAPQGNGPGLGLGLRPDRGPEGERSCPS